MLGGLTTKLIIAGVLVAAGVGLWLHYQGLHDEIAVLQGNQRQLETAIDLKDTEIASYQDMWSSAYERAEDADRKIHAAQDKVDELEQKLERHDLKVLVGRRPGMMTKRFQAGTDAVHNEIEEAANALLNR